MDRVNFIYTEVGTDIILSLSFDEDTEFGIEGFIMIRTPKYEFLLLPHERGASINWDEEADTIDIIKEITCVGNEITFASTSRSYQFDISNLTKDEMNELWKTVDRMNFDKSIKISRKAK
jgi:hypothetical protein